MAIFEINNDTEYRFQSCCWSGSTPVKRSTSRSSGTKTGSSTVRRPENTWNMYWPSSRLVAIVNRIVNPTAKYSAPIDASELLWTQHRVHEVHEGCDAQ